MSYKSLQDLIKKLEKIGELIRIKEEVTPDLEITEITKRIAKENGAAVLFEKVKGSSYPVLTNVLGTDRRLAMALGVQDFKTVEEMLEKAYGHGVLNIGMNSHKGAFGRLSEVVSMTLSVKGKCQEVIHHNPDLRKLPILHAWPKDEMSSIHLATTLIIDPETGMQHKKNCHMHYLDKKTLAMQWNWEKEDYKLYESYKKRGEKMPISMFLGGGTSAISFTMTAVPNGMDKMVKSITNDIYVPGDAEFVLEGYIDVHEPRRTIESHGNEGGIYSVVEACPIFHVTCMTHKKEPVYLAYILGKTFKENKYFQKAKEHLTLSLIQKISPEVVDIDFPLEGVFHGCVIVAIQKRFAGQAKKVMNTIWGMEQTMCSKVVIVVDEEIRANDYEAVAKRILEYASPKENLIFSLGPLDISDFTSPVVGYGYRLGIDATEKKSVEQVIPLVESKWHEIDLLDEETFEVREALNGIIREMAIIKEGIFKGYTIASIRKNDAQDINRVCQFYWDQEHYLSKCFIVMDEEVDIQNASQVAWYLFGNIDAQRDVLRIADDEGQVKVIIDATRKGEEDGHYRKWPESVEMCPEMKAFVNDRWEEYGINESFIKSNELME